MLRFAFEGTAIGHALRDGLFVSFPNLYGVLRITASTPIYCRKVWICGWVSSACQKPTPPSFWGHKGSSEVIYFGSMDHSSFPISVLRCVSAQSTGQTSWPKPVLHGSTFLSPASPWESRSSEGRAPMQASEPRDGSFIKISICGPWSGAFFCSPWKTFGIGRVCIKLSIHPPTTPQSGQVAYCPGSPASVHPGLASLSKCLQLLTKPAAYWDRLYRHSWRLERYRSPGPVLSLKQG